MTDSVLNVCDELGIGFVTYSPLGSGFLTPAEIALAWLLARRPYIVPIPGTTKLHRLDENIATVDVKLTGDDLREIDQAAAHIEIEDERIPPQLATRVAQRVSSKHLSEGSDFAAPR